MLSSDHIHMFVSVPPHVAISDLMRRAKGRSSYKILLEFPEIRRRYWGRRFWARGYFCTTSGNVTDDLDKHFNSLIGTSPFSRVFPFLCSERVVYGWTKERNRWQLLKAKTELDEEHVKQMQKLLFGRGEERERWLSDSERMSEQAIKHCLDEFAAKRRES